MELKTLILGLFMSTAAFAVKSGGGLAYVFLQTPGRMGRIGAASLFLLCYALVYGASALLLAHVDLTAHLDTLQDFFKSGMTLHFLLASLLAVWGTILLKQAPGESRPTRTWLALVVPCPVCFSVVLLSSSFAAALYPGKPLVFVALYAGFALVSLGVAAAGSGLLKDRGSPEHFLGVLMLGIAVYFLLSVVIVPQFADLDKIYRISLAHPAGEGNAGRQMAGYGLLALAALGIGFYNPFRRDR